MIEIIFIILFKKLFRLILPIYFGFERFENSKLNPSSFSFYVEGYSITGCIATVFICLIIEDTNINSHQRANTILANRFLYTINNSVFFQEINPVKRKIEKKKEILFCMKKLFHAR